MSELTMMKLRADRRRQHLLAGVSAATIIALMNIPAQTQAGDADRAPLWIELGGQLEQLRDRQEIFSPSFVSSIDTNVFTPPSKVQRPARYSTGLEGSIWFEPENSPWHFGASIRYGRPSSARSVHQNSQPPSAHQIARGYQSNSFHDVLRVAPVRVFADTTSYQRGMDLVLDFKAGRDVGLGRFGSHSSSEIDAGIRFASFTSKSSAGIGGNTEFHWAYHTFSIPGYAYFKFPIPFWHQYEASENNHREFRGVGPSLSWRGTDVVAGNPDASELEFDWGVNVAALFGRQRAKTHHETAGRYFHSFSPVIVNIPLPPPEDSDREHSVVIPNVGGFAGLSLKFPNAKLSLGYRADFFFNAIDGGIDTRKSENRGFFGPFASISIGVGGSSE